MSMLESKVEEKKDERIINREKVSTLYFYAAGMML